MAATIAVISWWSNCLGLTCLERLAKLARPARIHLVQVGKSERQKALFRQHMPQEVNELDYSASLPAEHGSVIEFVSRRLRPRLGACSGIWFFDHDTFVSEQCGAWLGEADRLLRSAALCTPAGASLTSPAFWLAPARLRPETPSFMAWPARSSEAAQRPAELRRAGPPVRPSADTLARARRQLAEHGLARTFLLRARGRSDQLIFPRHEHVGGLHALGGPRLLDLDHVDPDFLAWLAPTLRCLRAFFSACPERWLGIEDPVLLDRLFEFESAVRASLHQGVGAGGG